MLDWYHAFIACILLLWIISTPQDRNALRIVLIASLASEVIVDGITHQISGAWKLVIPGALEILTILALLKWARNRTGILQAGLLVFAWLTHLVCYMDIVIGTDLIYSRYEAIIFWVSMAQLAACYDTVCFNFERACSSASAIWANGFLGIPHASHGSALSRITFDKNVPTVEGKREAGGDSTLISQ